MGSVEDVCAGLAGIDVAGRIWDQDHTLWKPGPDGISDRLGWLQVVGDMRPLTPELGSFAGEVAADGFRHVVLLGMGGSSLGPEVLRATLGSKAGYPELVALDSTVPAAVRAVSDVIDPSQTLFLVSSKSGGTIEPNVLYRHFRTLVDDGRSFVAITDPGSSLAGLGQRDGFRRVFLNDPDIGGRYSVLSHFGLVPAALMGVDVGELLARAGAMSERCMAADVTDNPGVALGTAMGTHALAGRGKLTLVTSPAMGSFSLWVEQLIAESTGKEGTGIVPVAGEPLRPSGSYGADRIFVYLRLVGDANTETDAFVDAVESAGHPVVRLELGSAYDVGAEFFRWEFATAVAGSLLGINPFDQPDVQRAKDRTDAVLTEHAAAGSLPVVETASVQGLTAQARAGAYVAILAFIRQTPQTDRALAALRTAFMDRYVVATTVGYGPRFLHSTGQLHKGGPNSGLFLQLTAGHDHDLVVPGEGYTFGTLADAQALGDLMALKEQGRPVARVQLGRDGPSDILRLAKVVAATGDAA